MSFQVNQHVERLAGYQPFDSSFGQLYAEYVDTRQSDQLETQAFDFVSELIHDPHVRLIILTGDAGHGKTHLCGRLITSNDTSIPDPREHLRTHGDGKTAIFTLPNRRALHIIKDLSELDRDLAGRRLEDALLADDRVTVVCANEGRLRAVLGRGSPGLGPVKEALDLVLNAGQTSKSGTIHIIDMNHQSVAAPGGKSLVRQALKTWVSDGRKWTSCQDCDARPECPIYQNHRLLAAEDTKGESRRAGTEMLLRVVEQTGQVVTIRELLIFAAHAITGGLRCSDVHERVQKQKSGWQADHMFHQVMFGTRLERSDLERLRVFQAAEMLDPGTKAIRPVDDTLHMDRDGTGVDPFVPSMVVDSALAPKNHQQLRRDSEKRRNLYTFLRRDSYFEAAVESQYPHIPFAERLGLRYYSEFEKILFEVAPVQQDYVRIRNRLLSGLEAVQGARRSEGTGSFLVVDSAFASHRGSAAVVARKIMSGSVQLMSQNTWWQVQAGGAPNLGDAVDWVDRQVFVLLDAGREGSTPLAVDLNCRQFEFVCRAAQGLSSRAFFQADIRRIMAQLADLADGASATEEITVLLNGRTSQLVIDVGDVIQATGA